MFVGALLTNFSSEDEAFLESTLDDRSKQVRVAAADLLARLPESAYMKRMIARAQPLLAFSPAAKGGVLKKATAAKLDLKLPADAFDATWTRDAMAEKPETSMGRRQWWAWQILSRVPPSYWSTQWSIAPAELIAAVTGEFSGLVLDAWHQASTRQSNEDWIVALLLAATREGRGPITLELVNTLPPQLQQTVVQAIIESPQASLDVLGELLRVTKFSLHRSVAMSLMRALEQQMTQQQQGYQYGLIQVLPLAAVRIAPELYDELSGRWEDPAFDPVRKPLESFLQTLSLRRDLQREFAS